MHGECYNKWKIILGKQGQTNGEKYKRVQGIQIQGMAVGNKV